MRMRWGRPPLWAATSRDLHSDALGNAFGSVGAAAVGLKGSAVADSTWRAGERVLA